MARGAKTTEPTGQAADTKPAPKRPRKPRAPKVVAAEPVPAETTGGPTIDPEHPKPGQPPMPADPGKICANCGTTLMGHYCHECGQQGHLHNKLGHLLHEFVEGIAHFDGRLWRTLPLLALNPGRLSRDWIEGKRARYVAPLHLFLFAFFLFFTLPQVTGIHWGPDAQVNGIEAPKEGPARDEFFKKQKEQIDKAAKEMAADRESEARAKGAAVQKPGGLEIFMGVMAKKLPHMDYYQYKIKTLAYKLSFLLAPFAMLILWLTLLWKRGFSLYDHGTVALYGLGFLALLGAARSLLPGDIGELWALVLMIVMPIHAVRHLKGAYALSWPVALGIGFVVGVLTLITFLLFFLGVAMIAFFL